MSDLNFPPEFEEKVRKAMDVPNASSEFVSKLKNELAGIPVKMKPRFTFKPVWALAFAIVVLALIASAPSAVNALKKLFGYVPEVGLVENAGNLRMLANPVSMTRDGVTVTITSLFVYADRVELTYEAQGIGAADEKACPSGNPSLNMTDGDAHLKLPNGEILERDTTSKYPQNRFAMKPVYEAVVPTDIMDMTFVLKCIPFAQRGVTPENWEIPIHLALMPVGTVVGAPVVEVDATSFPDATEAVSVPTVSTLRVTFTLERVAQVESGPIFYIYLNVENSDPSMVTVFPRDIYVIDSQGQKIQYMNNSPYSEDPSTVWEYIPATKPADGALTLVVKDAVAKYVPLTETIFTFDAGDAPQPEQTWELNKLMEVAGYKVEVTSARAVTFDDIKDNPDVYDPQGGPDYPEGSQGFDYGYRFSLNLDPSLLGVGMDILSDTCGMTIGVNSTSLSTFTQMCRDGSPMEM